MCLCDKWKAGKNVMWLTCETLAVGSVAVTDQLVEHRGSFDIGNIFASKKYSLCAAEILSVI